MSFVKLENLNDFIQPSATCIKPVEEKKSGVVAKVKDISLTDCLACSGCITTAESVLIQQQNYEEFFKVLNSNKTSQNKKIVVITLAPQSVVSLAHKYALGVQETAERLASFFISLGCDKIYDLNLARHLALVESIQEYKLRKQNNPSALPIVSSVCPGWVCYAEKTNGSLVIPHLSRVKSPQQIMGSLVKQVHSSQLKSGHNQEESQIFHVTVMPCFDKKLEASRPDFKHADGSPDVDCVLTPVELEEILETECVSLTDFNPRRLDTLIETGLPFDSSLTSNIGSASGGYAENILLESVANPKSAKNSHNELDDLQYNALKNSDFVEVNLVQSELLTKTNHGDANETIPKVAIVNGFRNIQTIVQRLKRKALKYDYIEIMACPSGCINGGAQCRPNAGEDQTTMVESTRQLYKNIQPTELSLNLEADCNNKLYQVLDLNKEANKERLLYTEFHPVPPMKNLTVNW